MGESTSWEGEQKASRRRMAAILKPGSRSRAAVIGFLTALGLSFGATAGNAEGDRDVDGDAVYRWRTAPSAAVHLQGEVDVWAYLPARGELVVRLDAEQKKAWGDQGRVLTLDLERTAELDRSRGMRRAELEMKSASRATITGFPCYRTVQETYAVLSSAAAARPSLARWLDIGDSWRKVAGQEGGHDHHVLVLTNFDRPGPKPALLIMAAMHPRELATAEVATRFALHLLAGYGVDADITWLLDEREIHIVPQQNPDGRVEAEKGLLWRKNTNDDYCSGTLDRGVDLNRNSAWFHGGPLSSHDPCDLFYKGPDAASEPETRTIHDYLAAVFVDRKGDLSSAAPSDTEGVFISLHSFGEVILYPWHGDSAPSPNILGLRALARRFGAMAGGYTVCQHCIGKAGGTTVDAAHGDLGIAAFTFEMGTGFLESCLKFEDVVYPAMVPPLLYAAKVASRPYELSHGPVVVALEADPPADGALAVQAEVDDGLFESKGFGDEPVQGIVEVRAGFNLLNLESEGTLLTPADGIADSSAELFVGTVSAAGLATGRHTLFVQAKDASGAWGAPTAAFVELVRDPAEIFGDGFERGTTTAWSDASP